jgi:universal stress protein E
MAKRIRHILVAVGDVRRPPSSELRKAGALARASVASLELFHALAEPSPGAASQKKATPGRAAEKSRAAAETRSRERLERFARAAPLRGLRVKCTTVWDSPPHEAIVRRALTSGADLVIAVTRPHRLGGRLLLRNTDWQLIRHCPTTVLLVKSNRPYQKPIVIAAVDPFHAHARPADLDRRLLATGNTMAQVLHGTLHAFHAYMPLIGVAPLAVSAAPFIVLPPEAEQTHGRVIARAIDKLAEAAGVPPACRHVQMGDVTGELIATVRRTRASLVVMGAVSRSALARLLIGNTAERVLDKLSCDVLIVKPRGFKSKVARRPVTAATLPKATRSSVARVTLPPLF